MRLREARTIGYVLFAVAAIAAAVAAALFPYGANDDITSTYIVALAVSAAAFVWGVALVVSRRWRWLGVGFAVVATAYAVALAVVFVRVLPD
jgi:GNAT superfamily N-acetyltransferase